MTAISMNCEDLLSERVNVMLQVRRAQTKHFHVPVSEDLRCGGLLRGSLQRSEYFTHTSLIMSHEHTLNDFSLQYSHHGPF